MRERAARSEPAAIRERAATREAAAIRERAAIPPVSRHHLLELSGELGIMQHATGASPDPAHGYCTDDVARALCVDLLHAREVGWPTVAASAARAVAFLDGAFDPRAGRFRNLRRFDGAWLERDRSEDSHARAVLALATAYVRLPDRQLRATAGRLVEAGLPACRTFRHPRPLAAAVLAADALAGGGRDPGYVACRPLADALWAAVGPERSAATTVQVGWGAVQWPWPEPVLTYENGIVPQALIAAGRRLARAEMLVHGLRLLDWLLRVEIAPEGHFSIVGNEGWYPRGGRKAAWDQQPIEATSVLLAAEAAADATGSARYRDAMERCYSWFLGRNDLGIPVAIPERGSCHDGLTPVGPNPNQGAESTLAWLVAVEHVRRARRYDRSRPSAPEWRVSAGAQG